MEKIILAHSDNIFDVYKFVQNICFGHVILEDGFPFQMLPVQSGILPSGFLKEIFPLPNNVKLYNYKCKYDLFNDLYTNNRIDVDSLLIFRNGIAEFTLLNDRYHHPNSRI